MFFFSFFKKEKTRKWNGKFLNRAINVIKYTIIIKKTKSLNCKRLNYHISVILQDVLNNLLLGVFLYRRVVRTARDTETELICRPSYSSSCSKMTICDQNPNPSYEQRVYCQTYEKLQTLESRQNSLVIHLQYMVIKIIEM